MLRGVHYLSKKISQRQSWVSSIVIVTNNQNIATQMPVRQCQTHNFNLPILSGPARILRENVRRKIAAADEEPNLVKEARYPWNRKKVTVYYMLEKIDQLGKELLADENVWNVGKINDFYQEETRHEYWACLLDHSKLPLVMELKEKLKIAGILEVDFCRSIAQVHHSLEKMDNFYLNGVPFDRKMMLAILESLELDETQYGSLRILYELLNSPEWKIRRVIKASDS